MSRGSVAHLIVSRVRLNIGQQKKKNQSAHYWERAHEEATERFHNEIL